MFRCGSAARDSSVRTKSPSKLTWSNIELEALTSFMLATFVGLEVIRKVSPLLHTPLMSLTNAISAIASSARS